MKTLYKYIFGILISVLFSFSAYAGEKIQWVGVLGEEDGYHYYNRDFGHDLEFTRRSDGKRFDVVESKDLEALHIEKKKNLLVEIEGEKTRRFLFWGGKLIVTSFKVLEELDEIPRREYVKPSSMNLIGGRHNI